MGVVEGVVRDLEKAGELLQGEGRQLAKDAREGEEALMDV